MLGPWIVPWALRCALETLSYLDCAHFYMSVYVVGQMSNAQVDTVDSQLLMKENEPPFKGPHCTRCCIVPPHEHENARTQQVFYDLSFIH